MSPTAIQHCGERFPGSAVDYQVADLFHLPARWNEAFSLVIEIRTRFIQAALREAEFADQPATGAHGRFFTAVYARPGAA